LLQTTPGEQLALCLDNEINGLVDELELVLRRLNTTLEEDLRGVARDIEAILYNCGSYT
jgi:hypothetical protein